MDTPCTWSGCVKIATTHRIRWRDRKAEYLETSAGNAFVDRADVRNVCDQHAALFDTADRGSR